MSRPVLRPRPRRNIALSVSFNFPMACFDALNLGSLSIVIVYPKNFLFHDRSTALLASLTFNFSLLLKNNVTDSFTRSPPFAYAHRYCCHPHNGRTCALCSLTLYPSHQAGCSTTAVTTARLAAFLLCSLLSIHLPLFPPVDSV